MNGRLGILAATLLLQLVLVAVFVLNDRGDDGTSTKLLDFDPSVVDRVVIADPTESVELERKDKKWLIGAVPVDAEKADKLVSDFANYASPWPVTTTSSSAERFEVTAEKFQRHVTFKKGEEVVGEVWLGTSPGFQRVHARREGSDAVYSVPFSNFQAPVKAEEWLDKALLAADGAVKSVVSPAGFKLEKGEEGWLVDGVAANQDKATSFAERFENLRVLGMADASLGENSGTDKGTFTVIDGQGEYTLQLKQGAGENEYALTSSRRAGSYKLAAYLAEQLLEGADELLAAAEEDPSTEEGSGSLDLSTDGPASDVNDGLAPVPSE
jgi:Domain of unknown function (DUF4340)